jgi:hypothetical protein
MLLVFAIIAGTGCAIAVIGYCLRNAPIGYEDELGFHTIPQIKGSGVVRHRRRHAPAGALKSASANS